MMQKSAFPLNGIGKQTTTYLNRLHIASIKDLLFHLPIRYQDRTCLMPIAQLQVNEEALIEGLIVRVEERRQGKTQLICELQDDTSQLILRFFHIQFFQKQILKAGTRLRCFGLVRQGQRQLEMFHPECQIIRDDMPILDPHLTPIYSTTEGLSQNKLRKLMLDALNWLKQAQNMPELIPDTLLTTLQLPSFKEALQFIHKPHPAAKAVLPDYQTIAQKRLIFEELLAHRLSLLKLKQLFQAQVAIKLSTTSDLVTLFHKNLPYQLTMAQRKVIAEIQQDLARPYPMLRLVQGDVGCGKTVVAATAMLQAVANGYQAALMAPTELLAEQHHRAFLNWLKPLGINVVYLSGSLKSQQREIVLKTIKKGEAQLVIGTHALFQQTVEFAQLALVVIDEQHRFGVEQRAMLRDKGLKQSCPHQLLMTATPIPRTLAMSFYADLDCSIINELPPGRTPIQTSVMPSTRRPEIIEHIRNACQQGRQAYWVCPLIEVSDSVSCQAAKETADDLERHLPGLNVGLIHGQLSANEKENIMRQFQKGEVDVLVATTVIEVGVDVPNASLMIIENAERLGLSQLHQLRGRIGRGSVASYCILLYQAPLSSFAKERLSVLRETTDGFEIAQRDLALRGPGEVLGTRQTGEINFRIAHLIRDAALLSAVTQAADHILQDHQAIIDPLIERWIGSHQVYGKV